MRTKCALRLFALYCVSCLSPAPPACASSPGAPDVAQEYARCASSKLVPGGAVLYGGPSGYGVVVQKKSHFFEFSSRARFALNARDGRPVAQVLVDQPANRKFREDANWREYALQDVAEREGGTIERRELGDGARVLTVNRAAMDGKAAGESLLIDPKRNVIVQWNWHRNGSPAGVDEVRALQDALWQELGACLGKR